ncbi:MAG: TlpA family protein disulfide reductase, partial [Candidatus Marinimicrobia bacterium]|nr:TlpA family protein disulfide reductase [Candidatus Neomarinimicrobiota bacterium]
MKRSVLLLLVIALILSACGSSELQKKTPGEFDYDKTLSFIQKNQKKESPELYLACEQILPLTIERLQLDDYRRVMAVYKQNPDLFSLTMTLGFLAEGKIADPVLEDSVFAAVGRAHGLALSEAFALSAQDYYKERDFTEEELRDRVTAYRAMIGDEYAQLLIRRQRLGEALAVYESIMGNYRDTELLLNYAGALNNMNRYEASLIACIEALKMTPGSLDARERITTTAELLGYSRAEIATMIDETVFLGRNLLRQDLLADELDIPMPAFEIEGLDGSLIRSEDFRDKILIVSFFATWCGPCRRELPHLNETY